MPEAEYEAAIDAALRSAGRRGDRACRLYALLSADFVAQWRGRIVNIHPSLLPKYKGLDTHARAIAAGDAAPGASVHIVTEELDAGEVLGQAEIAILPGDTSGEPCRARARRGTSPLSRVCRGMADAVSPIRSPLIRFARSRSTCPRQREARQPRPADLLRRGQDVRPDFRHDHHGDGRTIVAVKTADAEESADADRGRARQLIRASPISAPNGSASRSAPRMPIGRMSATASRGAGNLPRRAACFIGGRRALTGDGILWGYFPCFRSFRSHTAQNDADCGDVAK